MIIYDFKYDLLSKICHLNNSRGLAQCLSLLGTSSFFTEALKELLKFKDDKKVGGLLLSTSRGGKKSSHIV
jgi:hypothetical protein